MKLTFLGPLYASEGPYACVYVDTSRDIEDPDRAIDLRWRHLRRGLEQQGADIATTAALAQAVGRDGEVPGPHGQAVFAARGRLLLAEELPEPPARDSARLSMLPDAMPLARQHAPDIPYVAVEMRRVLEPEPEGSQQDLEVEVQTGHWPISRVAGDDRVLRRLPSRDWLRDADRVTEDLMKLADGSAEVIVLAGDVWARGVLTHKMPKRLRNRIISIDRHPPAALPERVLLEEELRHLLTGRLTRDDRARVEMFLACRARQRGASEGIMAVVEALRRGQADAVLINDSADLSLPLWVGPHPQQVGLSEAELRAYGAQSCWEERADVALIRAVVGTRSDFIVVPREDLPLGDGIGALLRYTNES